MTGLRLCPEWRLTPDSRRQHYKFTSWSHISVSRRTPKALQWLADVTQRLSPASLVMMLTFVEANIETSPPVIEDGRVNHLASLHASALAAVADAQSDVDLYIRAQTLKGPRLRDDCGIAQRLLKEQRAPEALAHLDSIDATVSRDTYLLEDVRIEVMEALGRREAAQALRWSAFERRLSQEHLRG